VGPYLLDANLLIALAWPAHLSHARAMRWFARHANQGWATCPMTQTAFVRILSNPQFSPHALTPQNALRLLEANLKHPGHSFWADTIGIADAMRSLQTPLTGHRQITDAYLVALALHRKAKLATLDQKIAGWVKAPKSGVAEVIV
jgi:toxin-antitoxin system PIN domain toxin